MRTVSIIIPAYNEERSINTLLAKIMSVQLDALGFRKELIVVDDGSTDGTAAEVAKFPEVRYLRQDNQGKGAAVQRGIRESTGDFVLIQDADLEYDPTDYVPILRQVAHGNLAPIAIYGSRIKGQQTHAGWQARLGKHPAQGWGPWLANRLISMVILILYGHRVTDPLTGYKLYPSSFLRQITVHTHGFETDHELTAKLLHAGVKIKEVPIQYRPRSAAEGKKIKALDGVVAIWTLLRFRFHGRA